MWLRWLVDGAGVTSDLLAITHCAPSWDRVVVMARPSPVPPPVMKATLLLKLLAGSMASSTGGNRSGRWARTAEQWIHDWKRGAGLHSGVGVTLLLGGKL